MVRDYDAFLGFLAERRTMPFAYGRDANDCVAFALGAIKALTGRDAAPGARWTTKAGALRMAKKGGGLAAIATSKLVEIAPALAQRGDVAGVADEEFPGGVRLMIVEGLTLVGPGETGILRQQRSAMIRAWSIDA